MKIFCILCLVLFSGSSFGANVVSYWNTTGSISPNTTLPQTSKKTPTVYFDEKFIINFLDSKNISELKIKYLMRDMYQTCLKQEYSYSKDTPTEDIDDYCLCLVSNFFFDSHSFSLGFYLNTEGEQIKSLDFAKIPADIVTAFNRQLKSNAQIIMNVSAGQCFSEVFKIKGFELEEQLYDIVDELTQNKSIMTSIVQDKTKNIQTMEKEERLKLYIAATYNSYKQRFFPNTEPPQYMDNLIWCSIITAAGMSMDYWLIYYVKEGKLPPITDDIINLKYAQSTGWFYREPKQDNPLFPMQETIFTTAMGGCIKNLYPNSLKNSYDTDVIWEETFQDIPTESPAAKVSETVMNIPVAPSKQPDVVVSRTMGYEFPVAKTDEELNALVDSMLGPIDRSTGINISSDNGTLRRLATARTLSTAGAKDYKQFDYGPVTDYNNITTPDFNASAMGNVVVPGASLRPMDGSEGNPYFLSTMSTPAAYTMVTPFSAKEINEKIEQIKNSPLPQYLTTCSTFNGMTTCTTH